MKTLYQILRLLVLACLIAPAQASVVFTSLHSFSLFPNGANPQAALVQGSDGNFYGTTWGVGGGSYGTVFRISTNGVLTTLYAFSGGFDGATPEAPLVRGGDGNFYGTTPGGGSNNYGTVFKISTNGALTSLHSFTGTNDGGYPQAGLVQGSDGSFYGTTSGGGAYTNISGWGNGTVFRISTSGALTSLYSFTGGNDGAVPWAGLLQGSDGSFYGTTERDGTNYFGTIFKISTSGVLTSLHSFTGGNDGGDPRGGLVQVNDGDFYGTTAGVGTWGTVFRITANGVLTTLYSFNGTNDGGTPYSGLVQGNDGNFYGTTYGGGGTTGGGTVFKISPAGTLTTLYSFTDANDGASPVGGLVQGTDGNFYGTTFQGGTGDAGNVFKISTNGAYTSLYSFGWNDGGGPGGLVQGNDGNFYGITGNGGTNDAGTVFKIGTNGALSSLYSFTPGSEGNLAAQMVQGRDGNFYGTTRDLGTYGEGNVFKISTSGAYTSLYSFTSTNGGAFPYGKLVQGSDGNFYGTTALQGYYCGCGFVFKISTNGVLTYFYSSVGSSYAGLVQGSDGDFYGTTAGTVFRISTSGAYTNLYSFTGGNDFPGPSALVQGSDGNFYGTTIDLGTYGDGNVFKISTSGAYTSLYSFTGTNDGAQPSGLVQGSDGNFYGTTSFSGTYGRGTVFKISTNGALTTLYSFTGTNDGAGPSGLVQGSDGSFYGTTGGGGVDGAGTVFRLTIVPEVKAVTLTDAMLNLTWNTEAGGRYQPQFTSDLSSSNWSNLGSSVTATGATLIITDFITNGPRRFYRLMLSP